MRVEGKKSKNKLNEAWVAARRGRRNFLESFRSLKKNFYCFTEKKHLYDPSHSNVSLISELDDASSDALLGESVAAERWHKELLQYVKILDIFRERVLCFARFV
jgi:hypothetical protein